MERHIWETCWEWGAQSANSPGRSLLHDTLWKWREYFGGQAVSSIPSTPSGRGSPFLLTTTDLSQIGVSARAHGITAQNSGDAAGQNNSLDSNAVAGRPGPSTHPAHEERSMSEATAGWRGGMSGVDMDLVDEMNQEWLWNGGGLSSLLATDLDTMDLPLGHLGSSQNMDIMNEA